MGGLPFPCFSLPENGKFSSSTVLDGAKKLAKQFENDGLVIGIYVIDTSNQNCEISGDRALKKVLYDASSQINRSWNAESSGALTSQSSKEGPKPEGAKCWLPYLPPDGIEKMSDKI